MQIDKKSMQNRFRAVLGARGRLGDASGRVWNGLGKPSWAVLAAKLAVLAAKLAVRGDRLVIQDASEIARDEFFVRPWRKRLPKGSQSDFRTIFRPSRRVARQLRCARNISFNSVSARSQHVRLARVRAHRSVEKTAISASKIEPGRSKTTPGSRPSEQN